MEEKKNIVANGAVAIEQNLQKELIRSKFNCHSFKD